MEATTLEETPKKKKKKKDKKGEAEAEEPKDEEEEMAVTEVGIYFLDLIISLKAEMDSFLFGCCLHLFSLQTTEKKKKKKKKVKEEEDE